MKITICFAVALVFITLTGTVGFRFSISNTSTDSLPKADVSSHASATATLAPPNATVITWRGDKDKRFSNPVNWDLGRVPGPNDVAQFVGGSKSEVNIDPDAPSELRALVIAKSYQGTVTLQRDLNITSDLVLQNGIFRQGDHALRVHSYRQASGRFEGGSATIVIQDQALVSGGTFLTSAQTIVSSLTIDSPAVVRMAANSKLNLTGDGEPLKGTGTLDLRTNGSTSVEYTGRATADVTMATPIRGALTGSKLSRSQIMGHLRNTVSRGSVLQGTNTLSRNAAITLTAKEDNPFAAVIDTGNGFAYFGTLTTPGIIVKVRLSDFTRVGAIVLNPNEQEMRCATIDTANGFAYFGGLNGAIVKIRLSDFTRVDSLDAGGPLAAAVIDTAKGFAYFGAFTGPAAVIKVRLSDFTIADVLILDSSENGILSAVIDPVNGFAYFGTDDSPASVVKVQLSDFTRVAGIKLNIGEDELTSAVIDTANGFAYFGSFSLFFVVTKIRLSDFTRVGAIFENTGQMFFRSAVIDTNSGFAYFGNDSGNLLKVRLSDFTHVSTIDIPQIRSELNCAVIDPDNGFAYFGHGIRPGVIKIRLSDFTEVANVAFSRGEDSLGCAVIDTVNGFAYFGTDANPGLIVKVRLSDFTRVGILMLDDTPEATEEIFLRSAVIDTQNGFAYFGSDRSPGTIIKVRLSDFTRVGALKLNTGEDSLYSAVIDQNNGFAYFAAVPFPKGKIVKVRLSDFSRVGAVTLNDGERGFAAVIDAANDFAYFGAPTLPGTVVKIRLSDLTRVGALTVTDQVLCAVIDTINGFAYFGGNGHISKVRLSDFSLAGDFPTDAGQIRTGVIDVNNGFGYFGTFGSPGKVLQLQLASLTQVALLTLNSDEQTLYSSVIDTANHAAYFGTGTNPGKIVKINLPDAAPTPTPTPTPSPTPTPTPGPPQLLLEESGLPPNLAAALDSLLFVRDPFPVMNTDDLLNPGPDHNTRVIVFVSNLQLLPGEAASAVVVNLTDSNNQSFDVTAEDVRPVVNQNFSQVIFRLPNSIAIGTCTVTVKVHGQVSNPGPIRIRI